MRVDTYSLRNVSNGIISYLKDISFEKATLQNRHILIQYKLASLSAYFAQSANSVDTVENNLFYSFQGPSVTYTHTENWNATNQAKQENVTSDFSATVHATLGSAIATYTSDYINAQAHLNVGDVKAKGTANISLWKNKEFDPSLKITGQIDASLISTDANIKVGNENIYALGSVEGYAGVVYANATAVLSKDEQTLEAGIGAAALKGSCTFSLNVFGVKMTVTGEGSIGSFEANVSYSHKNREWEFGSKLGFICGLGFKFKISY